MNFKAIEKDWTIKQERQSSCGREVFRKMVKSKFSGDYFKRLQYLNNQRMIVLVFPVI